MLQITQTPIVLDEFGFTFLDLDSWPKGYDEVITIKQSLLDPAKPYQFYKDGVRTTMTAQERIDNGIQINVTSGTDGDGDATWRVLAKTPTWRASTLWPLSLASSIYPRSLVTSPPRPAATNFRTPPGLRRC